MLLCGMWTRHLASISGSAGRISCLLVGGAACYSPNEPITLEPTASNSGTDASSSSPATGSNDGENTTLPGTDSSDTALDGSGGGDACTHPSTCQPGAPAGWGGPSALFEARGSGDPPPCRDEFDTPALVGAHDLSVPPSSCTCECGAPSGVTCSETLTIRAYGASAVCLGLLDEWDVDLDCTDFGATYSSPSYWAVDPAVPLAGYCAATVESDIPDAKFEVQVALCSLSAAVGCGGADVCLPARDAPLCIWSSGDLACPPGGYQDRRLVYTSLDDSRDCARCTCSDPDTECVGAGVLLRSADDCSAVQSGPIGAGDGCTSAPFPVSSGYVIPGEAQATGCTPSTGEVIGDAIGVGPVTVCCE